MTMNNHHMPNDAICPPNDRSYAMLFKECSA